jgi:hypothetical protein
MCDFHQIYELMVLASHGRKRSLVEADHPRIKMQSKEAKI